MEFEIKRYKNFNKKKKISLSFSCFHLLHLQMEEDSHDAMTALKSELAALQYKRDKLLSELSEMRAQIRCRDQRAMELQSETENLREQAARQNAIIISLKKRIQVRQRCVINAANHFFFLFCYFKFMR